MKRITVEVSPELHQQLRLLAYTEDASLGSICRRALSEYCAARQADKIQLIDGRSDASSEKPGR